MNLPLVTVQIPTYNQEAFISEAIESALQQDYENLEVIVSDDASTDATSLVVQKYLKDGRLKYFRNSKNIGRVANYHKTLYDYTSGDWVVNLDGDDFFTSPSFIKDAIKIIMSQASGNIVFYQAHHNIEKLKNIFSHKLISDSEIVVEGKAYFINYYKVFQFFHSATLYKRDVALGLNFYSFDNISTDFNSIAKLFLKGNLILSSKEVAHWRVHGANESYKLNEAQYRQELEAMDNLAAYARPYFTDQKLKTWKNKMDDISIGIFFNQIKRKSSRLKTFRFLMANFRFRLIFLKSILKLLIKT